MELVYHSYEPDIASFALYLWMSKTHLAFLAFMEAWKYSQTNYS